MRISSALSRIIETGLRNQRQGGNRLLSTPVFDRSLTRLSAAEAIKHLQRGDFTVQELLDACFEQIERLNPAIHAWVFLDRESAIQSASQIQKKIDAGLAVGKLVGVPVGVKDIFNTADMPTQMGSPIWNGFQAGNDARVVHYLRVAD